MSGERVLVVDDNALSRKLLSDVLGAEGYNVRDVASGAEAFSAIAEAQPDLILLDIMMPGMDGFEVVRRLRADTATCATPLVIVSALDDAGSRARLTAAGINAMLTKPIDRWELRSTLLRVLAEPIGNDHE